MVMSPAAAKNIRAQNHGRQVNHALEIVERYITHREMPIYVSFESPYDRKVMDDAVEALRKAGWYAEYDELRDVIMVDEKLKNPNLPEIVIRDAKAAAES